MRVTIQYVKGCPHWRLADQRVREVIRELGGADATVEHQLIESPATAERLGFHGSPTILVDGRDPFATGGEPVGMSCRVFQTEEGVQGSPTEAQLRRVLT